MRTLALLAILLMAATLMPAATAMENVVPDSDDAFQFSFTTQPPHDLDTPGGVGHGDPCEENPDECANCNGQPGPCSCDDENPPVNCPVDCNNPRDSAWCHQAYCYEHPTYSSCNGGQAKCSDGFYSWDTDHDGTCDNDDLDDDGDGVPDTDDCDPRQNGPAVGAVDTVLYIAGVKC